jgi:hypothetical protein
MGIVQNNIKRPRTKARVIKTADGKVIAENIRGRSPGRGKVTDQRAPLIGTRTLGRGRVAG